MAQFYFSEYPTANYDLKKNGKKTLVSNITVRFKIAELLRLKSAVIYNYTIQDGDKPDIIAYKYYEDATLDWLIFLQNNIIDPVWEWPLDQPSFERYIRKKYGSFESALATHHRYEKIHRRQQILFDGTIVPEKRFVVDQETYNLTSPSLRREVDKYTYEVELNDARREIKILDKRYVGAVTKGLRAAARLADDV